MTTVDHAGEVTERPVIGPSPLLTGDRFHHELASGGGWGDPLARDPAAVLHDVRNGVIGIARALTDYGVVIADDETLDMAATEGERARRPRPVIHSQARAVSTPTV
jgi:N-methylhydantoinase B